MLDNVYLLSTYRLWVSLADYLFFLAHPQRVTLSPTWLRLRSPHMWVR